MLLGILTLLYMPLLQSCRWKGRRQQKEHKIKKIREGEKETKEHARRSQVSFRRSIWDWRFGMSQRKSKSSCALTSGFLLAPWGSSWGRSSDGSFGQEIGSVESVRAIGS
ncbi:hypothetical protein BJY01DRAFT_202767 [Aspergillus pseudoustus]|uniref:Uncharacterized protein n=1 Tax=Aspergillus pseudoustus TaxID=1810923 RepID=A0ABR4KZ40_9EURO